MKSFFRTSVFIPRDATQGIMIELIGDLDNSQTENLRAELEKYVDDTKIKFIILNANNLKFISSKSMGYLIDTVKLCQDNGTTLCLAQLQEQVKEVMELVGLHQIMPVFPNNPVAIAAMKNV